MIGDEDKPEETSQLLELTRRPVPGPYHIVSRIRATLKLVIEYRMVYHLTSSHWSSQACF